MLHCSCGCVSNRAIFAVFRALRGASARIEVSFAFQGFGPPGGGTRPRPEKLPQSKARGVKGEGTIVSGMAGRHAAPPFGPARGGRPNDPRQAELGLLRALPLQNPPPPAPGGPPRFSPP